MSKDIFLTQTNLFIKSFVNNFVGSALPFFGDSFHSFLFRIKCVWMIENLWPICIIFFYVFFCNLKVNHFLYCFIMFLYLVSSFSLTRSLLIPYAYVFIISIDCILSVSFDFKVILLISSVKTLYLSLSYLCFVFNINLFFYKLFMTFSYLHQVDFFPRWFILFKLNCFKTVFIIFRFKFSFYDALFTTVVYQVTVSYC